MPPLGDAAKSLTWYITAFFPVNCDIRSWLYTGFDAHEFVHF